MTKNDNGISIEQSSLAVTTLKVLDKEVKLFAVSDLHFDSPHCAREVLFSDFDRAVEENARIIIVGDIFDAMQGRYDPRRDFESVRPEYRVSSYYDALVEDAVKQLTPYAKNISLITPGNHETAVLKNANTYLSDRLVAGLNAKGGNIIHGGYGGWLRVMFMPKGYGQSTVNIKYFHGSGGEAPVTRGAIQTSRQAVYLPDANIVLNGHSHHAYWIPITRERISTRGVHYFDTQHHVRTAGYNQAYGDGTTGWEVTRGGVPKPLGGCFITLRHVYKSKDKEKQTIRQPIEVSPLIHDPAPISPVEAQFDGVVFPQE